MMDSDDRFLSMAIWASSSLVATLWGNMQLRAGDQGVISVLEKLSEGEKDFCEYGKLLE